MTSDEGNVGNRSMSKKTVSPENSRKRGTIQKGANRIPTISPKDIIQPQDAPRIDDSLSGDQEFGVKDVFTNS